SFVGITKTTGAYIFDDYGHHPLAIKYALEIARKKCKNKLVVLFQPHRYSRTKHLWNDFIDTFSKASIDTLIITDIYGAFEEEIPMITSSNLVNDIAQMKTIGSVQYIPLDFTTLEHTLSSILGSNDLLLLLGAGKIQTLSTKLLEV